MFHFKILDNDCVENYIFVAGLKVFSSAIRNNKQLNFIVGRFLILPCEERRVITLCVAKPVHNLNTDKFLMVVESQGKDLKINSWSFLAGPSKTHQTR